MHCEFGLFDNLIKRLILYVSGFLLLIVSTGSIQKASAQNPPVISAFPEPGLIYLNGSNQVVLDVTDTGKGVPKSQFKTIFEPGYTTKKRGWGLGLSLAKRIVENYHQGRIFIKQSELSRGTTFRILLNGA